MTTDGQGDGLCNRTPPCVPAVFANSMAQFKKLLARQRACT